jgi:hypothetical protein
MSTTNPQPGGPVGGLTSIPAGSPSADDHGSSGPPPAETIARGHEIDAYDTTSVLSVPLLVVLFFVLAFGTVSVIFYFIFPSHVDPSAHPMAVERNKQGITDRHEGIPEPRQDNFRELEGHSRSITSPEKPVGNSPLLHPEDIRVNPINTPSLYRTSWADPAKSVARISIDDAMELAVQNKDNKVLPVNKTHERPRESFNDPTASNAGRAPLQQVPQEKKAPEGKKPPDNKKAVENKKPPEGKK